MVGRQCQGDIMEKQSVPQSGATGLAHLWRGLPASSCGKTSLQDDLSPWRTDSPHRALSPAPPVLPWSCPLPQPCPAQPLCLVAAIYKRHPEGQGPIHRYCW